MQPSLSDRAGQTASVQTVSVHAERRILRVTLSEGRSFEVGAKRLRMQCRCAVCSRARIEGTFAPAARDIEIEQATPIGQYGLNLAFSDGHTRGIFPFAYLAELAAFQAAGCETTAENSEAHS